MNADKTADRLKPDVPTSEEFSKTLGQVTWLMTQSPHHRKRPIDLIEAHVLAPLMFKQIRIFTKGKLPIAAVIWAYVSPDVKEKLGGGDYRMGLQDWRSGPEVMVVDCVSPMGDPQIFIKKFMSQVEAAQQNKT